MESSWDPHEKATPTPPSAPHKKNDLSKIWDAADKGFQATLKFANAVNTVPARGIDAVLGAPQRFVAGAMAADQEHGGAFRANTNQELARAAYGAFHPNDQAGIQADAQKFAHVDRLKTNDPRFRGKLQNTAVDLGFQFLTDPLSLAGGAGLFREGGEKAVEGLAGLERRALTSSNQTIKKTARAFIPNPDEKLALTNKGQAASSGVRAAETNREARLAASDAALLAKHKKAIQAGDVPAPVRQRLLQEPYVHGTPRMRIQARKFGYEPTEIEAATPPTGVLHYNLKDAYDPHTNTLKPLDDSLLFEEKPVVKPKAGFEKHQKADAVGTPLYDRIEARLRSGRSVVQHRLTEKRIAEQLGQAIPDGPLSTFDERLKTTRQNQETTVRDRAALADVGAKPKSAIAGGGPLRGLSDAYRDSMFVNSLPHMGNIAELAFEAGGLRGVGRGAYHFLNPKGVPKALQTEIEDAGATAHFTAKPPGKYSPAKFVPPPARKLTQGALDRWDNAQRVARYEHVKKANPKLDDFEIAQKVRQDLGDYGETSYATDVQRAAGGPFPQWHNYIVPTTQARALLRNPQRVEQLARAKSDVNDNFFNPQGVELEPNKPSDEAAKAVMNPLHYFMGSSALGPLAKLIEAAGQKSPKKAQHLGDVLGDLAGQYVPGASLVQAFTNTGSFKSKAGGLTRGMSSLFGAYPKAVKRSSPQSGVGSPASAATPATSTSSWVP